MLWSDIQSNWNLLKSSIQYNWPELSYEDLDAINGNHFLLLKTIQDIYEVSRKQANDEITDWQNNASLPNQEMHLISQDLWQFEPILTRY